MLILCKIVHAMKKHTLSAVLLCILLVSCGTGKKSEDLKISIFCDHIETVARQESISFAEAATRIREMGYTGADVRVFQRPDEIKSLDSLGFEHACAITEIDYSKGEQKELEDKTLAFMDEHGFDKLLLVTGLMPSDSLSLGERTAARERIAAFAKRVTDRHYTIMVEDFDNPLSLCYNAEKLDSLFTFSKDLGLVFDTGNFIFAGDDALTQYSRFRGRIRHTHLKDRTAPDNMRCVPAGTGCVPIAVIVQQLRESGYKGWYTVEQYGSRHMLEDSRISFENVKTMLTD